MKDFIVTLRSGTARAYTEDLTDFSRWFEGANGQVISPELVTNVDLREYQSHMMTVRGLKPATINRRLAAIRAWLRWAKKVGYVQDLPQFPRWAGEPKRAPKSLGKVEEARFLRIVERAGNCRDNALVALLLYAGLRGGETTKIRCDEVMI